MCKFIFAFSTMIMVYTLSQAADGQDRSTTYACQYDSKKRGTAGEAEIEIKDGRVEHVHYGNATKGLPGKPGYSCELDAERKNEALKWQGTNKTLTIELEDAARYGGNSMTISRDTGGFLIDMRKVNSPVCGAGSQLPDSIYVAIEGRKCKVYFGRN